MFAKEKKVVKVVNSDIIRFTLQDYLKESEANSAKYQSILEYCRLDCVS